MKFKGNQIVQAIQVTTGLSNEATKARKVEGLIEAMNIYNLNQGVILTESEQDTMEIEDKQISIMPIWKWLLKGNDFFRMES